MAKKKDLMLERHEKLIFLILLHVAKKRNKKFNLSASKQA